MRVFISFQLEELEWLAAMLANARAIVLVPPQACRYSVRGSLSRIKLLIRFDPGVSSAISLSNCTFPTLVIERRYSGVGYRLSCTRRLE